MATTVTLKEKTGKKHVVELIDDYDDEAEAADAAVDNLRVWAAQGTTAVKEPLTLGSVKSVP